VALLCGPAGEAEIVQSLLRRDLPWKIRRSAPRAAELTSFLAQEAPKFRRKTTVAFFAPTSSMPWSWATMSTFKIRATLNGQTPRAFKAMRTWVVIPKLRARSIDPSKKAMFTAKVGIDATLPIADRRRFQTNQRTLRDKAERCETLSLDHNDQKQTRYNRHELLWA
jgi:hypothetical protein